MDEHTGRPRVRYGVWLQKRVFYISYLLFFKGEGGQVGVHKKSIWKGDCSRIDLVGLAVPNAIMPTHRNSGN